VRDVEPFEVVSLLVVTDRVEKRVVTDRVDERDRLVRCSSTDDVADCKRVPVSLLLRLVLYVAVAVPPVARVLVRVLCAVRDPGPFEIVSLVADLVDDWVTFCSHSVAVRAALRVALAVRSAEIDFDVEAQRKTPVLRLLFRSPVAVTTLLLL
jgi:hypothetical protein